MSKYHQHVLPLIAIVTIVGRSDAFRAHYSCGLACTSFTRRDEHFILKNTKRFNDDEEDNDPSTNSMFYNDFEDSSIDYSIPNSFTLGLSQDDKLMGSLKSKITQTRAVEVAQDAMLAKNWRRGNWSVRGFALPIDESSPVIPSSKSDLSNQQIDPVREEDRRHHPVHVSVVAAPTSSSTDGYFLPRDETLPDIRRVAVGMSDGSVFVVRLGDEYLTKLKPPTNRVADNSVAMGDDLLSRNDASTDVNDDRVANTHYMQTKDSQQVFQPFKILLHLQADLSEECHSIIFHDIADDNDSSGFICSASGDSGAISLYLLPPDGDDSSVDAEKLECVSLTGAHNDRIVSLKTIVMPSNSADSGEQHILLSASRDGTIACWDLNEHGSLLLSFQCMYREEKVSLACADVFNPSLDRSAISNDFDNASLDMLFFGTLDGHIIGYDIQNILATNGCTDPCIHFRAHGEELGRGGAVTAIKCGGDGTIPITSSASGLREPSQIRSSILLTGGEDGSVKQWEILTQSTSSGGTRTDHWPRLSSQRMKRRAHLFSPGHNDRVTALSQQSNYDSTSFISCSKDGSICVWDASTGRLYYRMDGFTSRVSSLACFGRDLLLTNGMDAYVCVHDFSVDELISSNDYEIDW